MKDMTNLQKVRKIVDTVKIAMLVTENEDGQLRSRPMYTSDYDDKGNIWFFTNEYSGKIEELQNDRAINLSYAHPGQADYLSISGRAYVIDEKEKMKELWNPMLKAWFPKGLESERLALLKVVPQQAEYWENSSNKLMRLFKVGTAALTDGQTSVGKHGKVHM